MCFEVHTAFIFYSSGSFIHIVDICGEGPYSVDFYGPRLKNVFSVCCCKWSFEVDQNVVIGCISVDINLSYQSDCVSKWWECRQWNKELIFFEYRHFHDIEDVLSAVAHPGVADP